MNIFVFGATGYLGGAAVDALRKAGHSVMGLARSEEAAAKLRDRGIASRSGDIKSPAALARAFEDADGIIYAAAPGDGAAENAAIHAIIDSLHGRRFVYTSGIWVLGDTGDRVATEDWPVNPAAAVLWRPAVEAMALKAGVVIRPGVVYGRGNGIPADFVKSAAESGAARFVGTGENRWPVIHTNDLADLYVLALEKSPAGTLLHATDGSTHRVKEIAEAASIGAGAGGRTESWPVAEARQTLGAYADALALDQQVSSEKARATLGWTPHAPGILDALRRGYLGS